MVIAPPLIFRAYVLINSISSGHVIPYLTVSRVTCQQLEGKGVIGERAVTEDRLLLCSYLQTHPHHLLSLPEVIQDIKYYIY